MKNRLFPIIIGLCFVSLVGLAFLWTTNSVKPVEAPIETKLVQESVKQPDMSANRKRNPFGQGTDATPQASLPLPKHR